MPAKVCSEIALFRCFLFFVDYISPDAFTVPFFSIFTVQTYGRAVYVCLIQVSYELGGKVVRFFILNSSLRATFSNTLPSLCRKVRVLPSFLSMTV